VFLNFGLAMELSKEAAASRHWGSSTACLNSIRTITPPITTRRLC
jgi:hypothetical protein